MLKHILILCNNEVPVYEYMLKCIAQMIQYPWVKSIMPTLISKEGAGKGTFFRLIGKMLGEQEMFGEILMALCKIAFLVNLNELSKKDSINALGAIKDLIKDHGMIAFKTRSFHRFIMTTNGDESITTTKDDRRNLIIQVMN